MNEFAVYLIFIVLLLVIALYGLLVTKNLIKTLIGLELLTKAVTLLLILGGYVTGNIALAQFFVITMIIIEVVVMVIAAGIVIGVFRHTESLYTKEVKNLQG